MTTSSRKLDHVRIASRASAENSGLSGFGDVTLVHRALPELRSADLDLRAEFLGHRLNYPLLITGMTGGHPQVRQINANLAAAAQKLGIAMGVGSQRAAIEDPTLADSFRIARETAPDILLIANLGIAQLISGYGLAEARAVLAMIDAQALAIHLNAAQEALQPNGDTDFSGGLEHISRMASGLELPILVKETGSGIAREEAMLIERAGAKAVDSSGLGGTSFAIIERVRQEEAKTGGAMIESNEDNAWTDAWGIPTVASVVELRRATNLEVVASGGVRNGLDAARAIALGATVVALGRPLVVAAQESAAAVEATLVRIISELRLAMFLTGSPTVAALREADLIIMGRSRNWLEARGVEYKEYANRRLARLAAPQVVEEQKSTLAL
jgi:isopentenyl-diphosphate Delta-isomerase